MSMLTKLRDLGPRAFGIALLAPLTLYLIYEGGWLFDAGIMIGALQATHEWMRIIGRVPRPAALAAYAATFSVILTGMLVPIAFALLLGVVLMLVLFLLAARKDDDTAGWVMATVPYIGGCALALMFIRHQPEIGQGMTYYLMLTVWGTDIGAYLAGRLIGGPKLLPDISPSKTWAGLAGGIALAIVCSYLLAASLGARDIGMAVLIAIFIALVAQLGDLFESYVKRRSGHKDSGDLIPGHGGLLDRIDGLVFAASSFVLFQVMIGAELQWW